MLSNIGFGEERGIIEIKNMNLIWSPEYTACNLLDVRPDENSSQIDEIVHKLLRFI